MRRFAAIPAHPQKQYTRRWRLYHFCGFYYPIWEVIPIAIYHWNIGIVSRGKGKSAVAASAYRSGEKLTNEWDGMTHDKSSLAPEGKPIAFSLDPETGFSWIGEYDITADELLSGASGNTATKTDQAERLILDLLADGKELASEDIVKAAAEAGISERTVQNAKRNMGGILGARRVGGQWYNFIKKKQPPEPAS